MPRRSSAALSRLALVLMEKGSDSWDHVDDFVNDLVYMYSEAVRLAPVTVGVRMLVLVLTDVDDFDAVAGDLRLEERELLEKEVARFPNALKVRERVKTVGSVPGLSIPRRVPS